MKIKSLPLLIAALTTLAVVGCGGPEAEAPPTDAQTQRAMSKFETGGAGQSKAAGSGQEAAKPTSDQ